MTKKDDQGAGSIGAGALRVIVGIMLFPFLWIGISANFMGLAERFSFVPGISRTGGLVSGIVAVVVTALVLGVIVGGAAAATGSDIPMIGGDDEEPAEQITPAPTPTATPTPASTPTPTTTPTALPTQTPEPKTDLEAFEADFRNRLNMTMENESVTGVPALATEYRETDSGQTELWLVYWECDELDPLKVQRVNIGNSFIGTAGTMDGEEPVQLRVYGVTNLKNYDDTITYINTSMAEATYTREVDPNTYVENWYDRQHEPVQSESDIAYQMVVNESGKDKADKAFKQHHEGASYCPGGASNVSDDD